MANFAFSAQVGLKTASKWAVFLEEYATFCKKSAKIGRATRKIGCFYVYTFAAGFSARTKCGHISRENRPVLGGSGLHFFVVWGFW